MVYAFLHLLIAKGATKSEPYKAVAIRIKATFSVAAELAIFYIILSRKMTSTGFASYSEKVTSLLFDWLYITINSYPSGFATLLP